MSERDGKQSNLITDEMVLNAVKDFKERYSLIGKDIRYVHDGHDMSLIEFVSEIENGTELGKQFRQKLVQMTLFNFFELFSGEE